MHWFQRHLTLKGRIILFLTAFFAALMMQMYVNHYQSNVVLDQLDRQMGNFHSISQFSSGIGRQLTALENFRWENGDANALMQTLQSGSTTADTWLWRIDGDLQEVGEEQYLLAQAVRTTYTNYDLLMDELQAHLKRGNTVEAAALYYGEVTLCGGYLQQYTDQLLQTAISEGQSTYTRLSALNERLKVVQTVTTLLCVLLGALFVRTVWHLLDPVQQMIVASRAIGRGELDTPDVIVQQTDEIGQLAGAFNTMKHSMARQVNMLREKNEIERQLGADPVRLSYDDVYSALAKQEIDGAENNWPSYDYTGHYEVVKYMLLDGHTRIPELMLASAEAMDKLAALDPEYPALVRECAREAGLLERKLWKQTEAASEAKMREAGVIVTTLDEEELERFRQATAPIYDMYADQKALIRRILKRRPRPGMRSPFFPFPYRFFRAGKPPRLSGAFSHSAQSGPDRIQEPAQKLFANFLGKQYIFLLLLQAFSKTDTA